MFPREGKNEMSVAKGLADAADRSLLDEVQAGIPVVERPFEELGSGLGLLGEEVMARLSRLKESGVIRQISAIFDTPSLGYRSALVAARVSEAGFARAVEVINSHPGVSHNYRREHEFNLWYTVAVSPVSLLGLDATIGMLHRLSGAESTRPLPTMKLYKIGVRFRMGDGSGRAGAASPPAFTGTSRKVVAPPVAGDIPLIRSLQEDLDLVEEPFVRMAAGLGISFGDLRDRVERMKASGLMRRFSAVLRHRKAGYAANAMGVWSVPDGGDKACDRAGEIFASFDEVSHCYRRPRYPDWPYDLFTMVHGRSREECGDVLARMAAASGLEPPLALYSTEEFKKVRVRYFEDAERRWEEEHAANAV